MMKMKQKGSCKLLVGIMLASCSNGEISLPNPLDKTSEDSPPVVHQLYPRQTLDVPSALSPLSVRSTSMDSPPHDAANVFTVASLFDYVSLLTNQIHQLLEQYRTEGTGSFELPDVLPGYQFHIFEQSSPGTYTLSVCDGLRLVFGSQWTQAGFLRSYIDFDGAPGTTAHLHGSAAMIVSGQSVQFSLMVEEAGLILADNHTDPSRLATAHLEWKPETFVWQSVTTVWDGIMPTSTGVATSWWTAEVSRDGNGWVVGAEEHIRSACAAVVSRGNEQNLPGGWCLGYQLPERVVLSDQEIATRGTTLTALSSNHLSLPTPHAAMSCQP